MVKAGASTAGNVVAEDVASMAGKTVVEGALEGSFVNLAMPGRVVGQEREL